MLLDPDANILVQGITGREASAMVADMLDYGSRITTGVTPGKGGQEVHGVPVFDTVRDAVSHGQASISIISVPAPAVLDATLEAMEGGIQLCLIMSERVPRLDTCKILHQARQQGCTVIGPNSLGLIRPGITKLGTIGGRRACRARVSGRGRHSTTARRPGIDVIPGLAEYHGRPGDR